MKILLTSIGTRGDMEPFLALGEIFKEKGHHVICLFPAQFKDLVIDSGFEFASLGKEFMEMLDTPEGRTVMGGGPFGIKKLWAVLKLLSKQTEVNKGMIIKQEAVIGAEQPDRIIHNGKALYPIIWSVANRDRTVFISPVPFVHYVKDHAVIAFNRNFGPIINKLTYRMTEFVLIRMITSSMKWLNESKKISHREIKAAYVRNKVVYTISPSLFQRPTYWPDNLQVLGYHERNKINKWAPSPELQAFLGKHPKLVFITFGSMINTAPTDKTRILLEVLERNNIPAIINTASGGLVEPSEYNADLIHFVSRIPYDWIFPKMYAVVQHGGSGTTHTALKYGCATLIIPHIIDQYVWSGIVYKKGVGPKGIDVSKINVDNVETKILDLLSNEGYKKKAEELGRQMRNEEFRKDIYDFILGGEAKAANR